MSRSGEAFDSIRARNRALTVGVKDTLSLIRVEPRINSSLVTDLLAVLFNIRMARGAEHPLLFAMSNRQGGNRCGDDPKY